MLKLYFAPGACSLAPHIALHEAKLPFEAFIVDLKTKVYSGGDYRAINPKGSVPALQLEDGKVLTEASVLLQYIADQNPAAQLLPPAGTWERYQCQEWLNYIATELHKGFSPLWNPLTPDAYKEMATKNLFIRFEYVNSVLSRKDYLMGPDFTVADTYLYTVLNWAHFLRIDLSPWTALVAYLDKIKSRPSTQAALETEKKSKKSV